MEATEDLQLAPFTRQGELHLLPDIFAEVSTTPPNGIPDATLR
ncbi:hypothetical protein [Agromyces sp. Root81]|nr:hypothetical protein [Agromyces sp. Root81]